MDEQGRFHSTMIRAAGGSLAAGAVLRQQSGNLDAKVRLPDEAFETFRQETLVRLEYLATALETGRPTLFEDHVAWLKATYLSRGFAPGFLETHLTCLRDELAERLPDEAADAAAAYIEDALERAAGAPAEIPSLLAAGVPHAEHTGKLLLALLEGRRQDALDLVTAWLDDGLTSRELLEDVVVRAQHEVGRMWQVGEVDVAEEHLSSQIVRDVLTVLRAHPKSRLAGAGPEAPDDAAARRRVLVTSCGGDLHDLGAQVVAIHFELAGWNALFLGANTPTPDVVRATRHLEPDLLALSVSLAPHIGSAAELIATLRADLGDAAPPVMVGGRPFVLVPDLWEVVGADACGTSGAHAVEAAGALLGKS